MIFKDLDRLLVIKKHGSFSKAADELYISRSALTQQLKQLEENLGFSIFHRDHKGVTLTKEGSYFIESMQKIITSYDETVELCRQNQHTLRDSIVIGMMPNLKSPFLPLICKEFSRQYPMVEIVLQDFFPKDYVQKFQTRDFDISAEYFYNYIHSIKGIRVQKVATVTHSLHVLPTHPLASRETIDFSDLRGHKLIMYHKGITRSEDILRDYLLRHEPEIEILDIDNYNSSLFTKCALHDAVLLSYSLYEQSFPEFVHIPASWKIPIDLGFCYHEHCRPIVNDFMTVAKKVIQQHSF